MNDEGPILSGTFCRKDPLYYGFIRNSQITQFCNHLSCCPVYCWNSLQYLSQTMGKPKFPMKHQLWELTACMYGHNTSTSTFDVTTSIFRFQSIPSCGRYINSVCLYRSVHPTLTSLAGTFSEMEWPVLLFADRFSHRQRFGYFPQITRHFTTSFFFESTTYS